jgi:Crinkler effector protein N-terminal domain
MADIRMADTPADSLVLFCLIQNEPPALPSVFEVTVPVNAKVAHLQKAIKQEKAPELDQFAADSLVLWKVSIS